MRITKKIWDLIIFIVQTQVLNNHRLETALVSTCQPFSQRLSTGATRTGSCCSVLRRSCKIFVKTQSMFCICACLVKFLSTELFHRRTQFKFPPMSSYQRMLVHRMSALYNMEHNVDSTGAQVVVAKTATSKTPDLRLRDQIRGDLEMEPRKSILKRDTNSLDDPNSKVIFWYT